MAAGIPAPRAVFRQQVPRPFAGISRPPASLMVSSSASAAATERQSAMARIVERMGVRDSRSFDVRMWLGRGRDEAPRELEPQMPQLAKCLP